MIISKLKNNSTHTHTHIHVHFFQVFSTKKKKRKKEKNQVKSGLFLNICTSFFFFFLMINIWTIAKHLRTSQLYWDSVKPEVLAKQRADNGRSKQINKHWTHFFKQKRCQEKIFVFFSVVVVVIINKLMNQ